MKRATVPLTVGLLLTLTYVVLRVAAPDFLSGSRGNYLLAAALAALSVALVRAASYLLFEVIFQKRKGREAPALLRVSFGILAYTALFVFIYTAVLKRDVSGVWATSAVVTIILGLALQDTLGNFFAGLSLHIEQPYHIGDSIRLADMLGRVESVTWRTTAIRTNNGTLIVLPNSKVAREALEVFPLHHLNRRVLRFPAPYNVPPETVIRLAQEAVRSMTDIAPEIAPRARVAEFGESSITYEVLYWVKDYMLVPDMDARIRERIWYAYRRNEIDVPVPIRHVLVERARPARLGEAPDVVRTLGAIEIFEPLGEDERRQLAAGVGRSVYAPGEVILRRGEHGDSMFVVRRGRVEVKLADNGRAECLAVLGPGEFFGEMALFTGEPRSADVNALEEVEVLEIRKEALEPLLKRNHELADAFSQRIAERQVRLSACAAEMQPTESRIQKERLLPRIRRFFSLN